MSRCTAAQAIKEARSWVGYLEKKSDKSLKSKTKNAGYNNYTIFGKTMHAVQPSNMDFPAFWCDAFFDCVIYWACGSVAADAKRVLCGDFDDYTVQSAQHYKDAGRWGQAPKKGAQIFFAGSSGICHTGMVVSFTASTVTTVEGNTSATNGSVVANGGCVAMKTYSRSNSRIAGYGYPRYATAAKTSQTGNQAAKTAEYTDYTVTAKSGLNCRKGPGTSYAVTRTIAKGATVHVSEVSGGWAKTKKGDWCSAKYLSAK